MSARNGTPNARRILHKIAAYRGATTIGLVASDLGLHPATVKRYVTAMVREGLVEIRPDEFGNALAITDACARELEEHAAFIHSLRPRA